MKRTWIILSVVAIAIAAGLYFFLRPATSAAQSYKTAQVELGTIEATVTSTGTITAVGTVQVGTQVSGNVEEVLVDFNDQVRRGQLLARLDTRVLQASVDEASAGLDRAKAQYAAALDQYNRNKPLFDKKYISAIEFSGYRSAMEAARASVSSAQIAVQRARTNLGYTEIRSPSDGTVIQRSVEPGQTVAASLSTPTLFTIAQDLSHMQIEVGVDESDIGQIKQGQRVTFSVQSQPDRTFSGVVKQIRLLAQTVQNVVNYTVVVDATNNDGALLPGMTATVSFEVNRADNVLVVPNATLRFQPPPEVLEEVNKTAGTGDRDSTTVRRAGRRLNDSTTRGGGGARGDSIRSGRDSSAGAGRSGARRGGGQGRAGRSRIWVLEEGGKLRMISVRVGLSDGQLTEVRGPDVREGMTVVIGVVAPESARAPAASGLPFGTPATGTGNRGQRGGRGGF